jgi:hypothetical protein
LKNFTMQYSTRKTTAGKARNGTGNGKNGKMFARNVRRYKDEN